MGEISNKTLALLVLAALVVVVVSTSVQMNTFGKATGLATTDTGTVNLSIGGNVAIQVHGTYDNIDFGTCTPNATGVFTVDSADGYNDINCTGDSSDQYIELDNVGNVNANVTVLAECTVANWLPETGTRGGTSDNTFQVKFTDVSGAACDTGTVQTTYTDIDDVTTVDACDQLEPNYGINMSAAIGIDGDTQSTGSCGGDLVNDITFSASQSI